MRILIVIAGSLARARMIKIKQAKKSENLLNLHVEVWFEAFNLLQNWKSALGGTETIEMIEAKVCVPVDRRASARRRAQ